MTGTARRSLSDLRLIVVAPKQRWTGSRALVPVAERVCPECRQPLGTFTVSQPALFRHAGHGATSVSTVRHCPCGWHLVTQTQETRPA